MIKKKKYKDGGKELSNDYKETMDAFLRLLMDKEEGPIRLNVDTKALELIMDEIKLKRRQNQFRDFLKEMSLVYLIATFEDFLKSNLEIAFRTHPQRMISKERKINYEDLFSEEFKNLEDLRVQIVRKEIRQLMYKDIQSINDDLDHLLNLDMNERDDWGDFKERFYRRNICIHNDCYPNERYRKKTSYDGEDTRLDITSNYLEESFDIFYDVSIFIYKHMIDEFEDALDKKEIACPKKRIYRCD